MRLKDLKSGAHIHLMGICGTAMASLAGLLKDRGFKVTGSDSNPYPPMSTQLEQLQIPILKPYQAQNLHPEPDFVIVGNVISATNEEAQELMRLKIPMASLPQAMGELIIEDRQSIVISGTHGKTTTTSMMAWVATVVGVDPGFLIGGIPKNFSRSFQNPKGNFFIIEGDEYDTAFFDKVPKFIHYRPRHVVLTSVEFDHADIYKDLQAVKEAFARLMKLIPQEGTLLWWAEDPNVEELSKQAQCKKWSYGINKGDYQAHVIKTMSNGTEFQISFQGKDLGVFHITMTGQYNVLNATTTIGLAHQLRWPMEKVKEALVSFAGVKRRQEILGEPNGILVIEDFAHHPTAVRETLKGIRDKYPQRKLFAVFEPRSATSRRKIFQKDYVQALQLADDTIVARAFDQTKIDETNRFSSEELVKDLKDSGKSAFCYAQVSEIVQDLVQRTKRGDVIIIMSNGGFDGIYGKLMTALQNAG